MCMGLGYANPALSELYAASDKKYLALAYIFYCDHNPGSQARWALAIGIIKGNSSGNELDMHGS